jgi:hypothetical protein
MTTDKKEVLTKAVEQTEKSASKKALDDAATQLKTDVTNVTETIAGSVSGAITGGIETLGQKKDALISDAKEAKQNVEGLLNGDAQSIENLKTDLVNGAMSALSSKLGSKVQITFGEPDSNGIVFPISASLDEEGGISGTVAAVLKLITGLGVDGGSLQEAVVDATNEGLKEAGTRLQDKIGAFTSAENIKELTSAAVNSVTDQLVSQSGTLQNINTAYNFVSAVDSDGLGNVVETRTAVDNAITSYNNGDTVTGIPEVLTEFNKSIAKVKDDVNSDLNQLVTTDKQIKQDLVGGKSDFENLSGGKNPDEVIASIDNKSRSASNYTSKGADYQSLIKTRATKNSEIGIVQGLNAELNESLTAKVKAYAPKLTDDQIQSVIAKAQGDAGEFSAAREILVGVGKKGYESATTFLNSIDSTITASTRPSPSETVFAEPYVIGSFEKQWNDGAGDPYFPYISSLEEIVAEFQSITRDVTEMVVHWTETNTNKNIGSEEINKYHIELGLDGIGYHYVIRRDGSLQRGRPINLEGQHSPVNSHDTRSIGVVFVGGINVPTGTPNSENFIDVQSLTRSQFNTFDHICRAFYNTYPGGQVLGHNDVDEDEVDPGFDVINYVGANFNKTSLYDALDKDPSVNEPFTVDEINTNDE